MDRLQASAIPLPGIEVRVVERCTSTNSVLMGEQVNGRVLLAAQEQTAGRGRRGRRWHSVRGAGLTFSLSTPVRRAPRELATLSLVAGVAVARALRALGAVRAALKWPNDLLVDGAKLGGILVETKREESFTRAVIGIGINYRRTPGLEVRLRRPVAFLEGFISADRNEVLRQICVALLKAIEDFEEHGLEGLRREWEALDAHAGRRLRVRLAGGAVVSGVGGGLAADGALRLLTRRGVRTVRSGRVVTA